MSFTSWFDILVLTVVFSSFLLFKKKHVSFLTVISVLIVLSVAPLQGFLLSLVTLLIHCLAKSLERRKSKVVLFISILFLIGFLSVFKYTTVQNELFQLIGINSKFVGFIGASYFTFKFWHYLFEVYSRRLKPIKLKELLLYIFFFPTYVAGPIERVDHFIKNTQKPVKLNFGTIFTSIERILLGLFKKLVIAELCASQTSLIYSSAETASASVLWLAAYLYSIQIYADFSGYTDIAIGVSGLFGYDIIENFNKPYLQKNISSFWKSWHISLTNWLMEYIFLPIRTILPKFIRNDLLAGVLARIINMVVCGIWHGATNNFVIWGLYHGIGLSVYRIYSQILKSMVRPERLESIKNNKLLKLSSVLLTFHFVTIGWVYFANDISTANLIVYKLLFGMQLMPALKLTFLCLGMYLFLIVFDSKIIFGRNRKTLALFILILGLIYFRSESPVQNFIYSDF